MKRIVLKGNPLSTSHIYLSRGKMRFMKKEAKDRKEQYAWEAKGQYKGQPIQKDITVDIVLYFGDKRKRDIDNFNKLWMDSLEGIVYEDDKQIQELHTIKSYDKQDPRIEVFIN